jgi:heat shock protein HslJ
MPMSTRWRATFASLIAAPLVLACTPMTVSSAAPPPLDRSAWVLSSLPGQPLPAGAAVTLRFDGDRVSGSDGCNRFGGPYAGTGGRLRVGPNLASTQMACPDALRPLAATFGRALAAATGYRIEGTSLVLLDDRGQPLARFAPQPAGLAGTAWDVDAYNDGRQAVVSLAAGSRITLEFNADGGVGGSGGCNRYSGNVSTGGEALRIGPLRSTRMACAPELMQQETAFLRALESATSARREGDRLELRTATGALAVTARAAARP